MINILTLCIGFADILDITLPINKTIISNITVLTSPDDTATIEVCKKHSVECIQSYTHKENNQTFNKGKILNFGLNHILCKNLFTIQKNPILYIDSDIILNPKLKTLDPSILEDDWIYGCKRAMITDFNQLYDCIKQHKSNFDLIESEHIEYDRCLDIEVIGYFQLFKDIRFYDELYDGADKVDLWFALKFNNNINLNIPCIHIGYKNNWHGRLSDKLVHDPTKLQEIIKWISNA
jgi:hypothetical protein